MTNPLKIIRLLADAHKADSIVKGNAKPMQKATQIVALFVQLVGTLGLATAATTWTDHHLMLVVGINLALTVGHALLPSVIPGPVAANPPDLSKFGSVILAALLLPALAHSQSAVNATVPSVPQASPTFTSSAGPLAVEYAGTWSAASVERESLDIADFGAVKGNHVLVNGIQLEMPGPGVNLYMGGVALEPDLSALFKRTNLPAGSLGAFFDGNVGVGTPASGASEISWMAGGGVAYKLASALTWQPLTVQYGRFGANGFVAMSTQLEFAFKR